MTLRYIGPFNYLALHIYHCITKGFTEPVYYSTGIIKICQSLAPFDRLCFTDLQWIPVLQIEAAILICF